MSRKLRPTRGIWGTDEHDHDAPYQNIVIKAGTRSIAVVWIDDAPVRDYNTEQRENVNLICEAGTVFHECELSPRELLEGYRELRTALALCKFDSLNMTLAELGSCHAALAKHKEV